MSNHLTSLAYKVEVGSLLRKSVLVLLADKASDDGSGIWASKQTMADELCCSKQSVINTFQQFVTEGLLSETGKRKNPNGYTVTYSLDVAAIEKLPRVKRHQSKELTGQPDLPVKGVDGTSQPRLPKPPLNRPSKAKAFSFLPIPDDWWPAQFSEGTQSRKVVDGWPPGELEAQVEQFRAHHGSKSNTFTDPQKAWSTWVLNTRKWGIGRERSERDQTTVALERLLGSNVGTHAGTG